MTTPKCFCGRNRLGGVEPDRRDEKAVGEWLWRERVLCSEVCSCVEMSGRVEGGCVCGVVWSSVEVEVEVEVEAGGGEWMWK